MKKELRPFHDPLSCEVCGRTILKGERTETYLAPGGHRNLVCELCFVRAEHAGWIRESAADDMPTRSGRQPERRALLGRFMRRRGEQERPPQAATPAEPAPPADAEIYGERDRSRERDDMPFDAEPDRERQPAPRRRERPKDPRHVRAVPTTAEAKVERALDLFNSSEHQRTAAGLTRTLGFPWATATPDPEAPSAVVVVIAWELSWYRYRIDLGDAAEIVALLDKGDEIADIAEPLREWNAGLDEEGRLVMQGGVAT